MTSFETRFSVSDEDTTYHLLQNPDAGATDFSDGAQLHWECAPDWKPNDHFFIPANLLRVFASMLNAAADIAEGKK